MHRPRPERALTAAACAALVLPVATLTCALAISPTATAADPFADHIRATPPRTPEEERKAFKLPAGFSMQLFAAEPDIGKPINIAFDARGRLWMSEGHRTNKRGFRRERHGR